MWILVVGGAAILERADGGIATLGELGCRVRSVDLWDNLDSHDFASDPPSVILVEAIDQVEAGRAAVTRLRAVPALAEIPTAAEAKLQGVVSGTWYGLMAPAKTPPEVIAKVNAALNKALQHPDTVAFFKVQGVQSVGGSADEFGQFIRAEAVKWGTLAKAVGVKLD